jgi:hypothetical protein
MLHAEHIRFLRRGAGGADLPDDLLPLRRRRLGRAAFRPQAIPQYLHAPEQGETGVTLAALALPREECLAEGEPEAGGDAASIFDFPARLGF